MREKFRQLSARLWTFLGLLGWILIQEVLTRAGKLWVPEGQEGTFISRTLRWARDVLTLVPTEALIGGAVAALALYVWEERKRWIAVIERVWVARERTYDRTGKPAVTLQPRQHSEHYIDGTIGPPDPSQRYFSSEDKEEIANSLRAILKINAEIESTHRSARNYISRWSMEKFSNSVGKAADEARLASAALATATQSTSDASARLGKLLASQSAIHAELLDRISEGYGTNPNHPLIKLRDASRDLRDAFEYLAATMPENPQIREKGVKIVQLVESRYSEASSRLNAWMAQSRTRIDEQLKFMR